MPAIPAIVGIASAGSSIYSAVSQAQQAKKAAQGQTATLPWDALQNQQIGLGMNLGDWLNTNMNKYNPGAAYTGKISTQMSPWEQAGMGFLDQYLSSQPGALNAASQNQLLNTLQGTYMNPENSPYIQAMRKLNQQSREDAITAARRGQGYRNKFLASKSIEEEGDITERNLNNLDALIGAFVQNERQNQLGAVPQAISLDRYNQQLPLEKTAATQKYGSLSRVIEEANMEAAYNQWARQRNEQADVQNMAAKFAFGGQPFGTTQAQIFPGTAASTGQSGDLGSALGGILGGLDFQGLVHPRTDTQSILNPTIWQRLAALFKQPVMY